MAAGQAPHAGPGAGKHAGPVAGDWGGEMQEVCIPIPHLCLGKRSCVLSKVGPNNAMKQGLVTRNKSKQGLSVHPNELIDMKTLCKKSISMEMHGTAFYNMGVSFFSWLCQKFMSFIILCVNSS